MVPKPVFLEGGTGWAASVHFHPAWARRWKVRGSPKKEKLVSPEKLGLITAGRRAGKESRLILHTGKSWSRCQLE